MSKRKFEQLPEQKFINAVKGRNYDLMSELVENESVDINIPIDEYGQTALHYYSYNGILEGVRFLLTNYRDSIDIDRVRITEEGKVIDQVTALNSAAACADTSSAAGSAIALLLLENNANPNTITPHATTPLHEFAEQGNIQLVRALLEAGADSLAEDLDGNTALDLARDSGRTEIANLLENPDTQSIMNGLQGIDLEVQEGLAEGAPVNRMLFNQANSSDSDSSDSDSSVVLGSVHPHIDQDHTC